MNVQRILEEPLIVGGVKNKEERLQRVRKAMEEVKLSPVEDFLLKFPHMLSGGQQQRVVIARAMIMEPKFLVADEPVSMLDASVRVEILKLLRGLQETHNLSVIYITHDLSTVSYFSERIFVMYAGNLVEKASVRQVLDNPLHPYTMALLTGTSEPDAQQCGDLQGDPAGRTAQPGQSTVRLPLPSALPEVHARACAMSKCRRISSRNPAISWSAGFINEGHPDQSRMRR